MAPGAPGWPTGNAQWSQVRGPSKAVGGVKSAAGEQASPALRDSPPLTSPTALTTGYNPAPLFSGSGVRRGEPHQHTPWWRLARSVPGLDSEHGAVTGRRLERGVPRAPCPLISATEVGVPLAVRRRRRRGCCGSGCPRRPRAPPRPAPSVLPSAQGPLALRRLARGSPHQRTRTGSAPLLQTSPSLSPHFRSSSARSPQTIGRPGESWKRRRRPPTGRPGGPAHARLGVPAAEPTAGPGAHRCEHQGWEGPRRRWPCHLSFRGLNLGLNIFAINNVCAS